MRGHVNGCLSTGSFTWCSKFLWRGSAHFFEARGKINYLANMGLRLPVEDDNSGGERNYFTFIFALIQFPGSVHFRIFRTCYTARAWQFSSPFSSSSSKPFLVQFLLPIPLQLQITFTFQIKRTLAGSTLSTTARAYVTKPASNDASSITYTTYRTLLREYHA